MPSNIDTLVTVFGGSGFVGRHVVRALAKRDYRIRVAVRRPELAGHLQPLGKVGQIHAVQANLRYPASVEAAMRDCHVAINLVGILAEGGAQTFRCGAGRRRRRGGESRRRRRRADGACLGDRRRRKFAVALCALQGRRRKGGARGGARGDDPAALGGVRARGPVHQPLRGAGKDVAGAAADRRRLTKMQPVYVGDVATAVADAVDGKTKAGAMYELGGPEVLTMREIMEIILAIIERKRMLLSLPFGLAKLQALLLQFAPGPLKLTPDQVALLRIDNVVSDAAKAAGLTLEGLGITPDSLEAIAPQYLWRFRKTGQFQKKSA